MIRLVLCFLLLATPALSATRIFYEGFEATYAASPADSTEYRQHFMEWQFGNNSGPSSPGYWDQMTSEYVQSDTSFSGTYSQRFNPALSMNGYAQMGLGDVNWGNNSNYDLEAFPSQRYYIRWRQRWEGDSPESYHFYHKIIYAGCGISFFYVAKTGPSTWIMQVRDEASGASLSEAHPSSHTPNSGTSLDDDQWHKLVVYIDMGTGNDDGEFYVEVDDVRFYWIDGLDFIHTTDLGPCVAWPGNTSSNAAGIWGDQNTYLDQLEIYTVTSITDIPADDPPSSVTAPSGLGAVEGWRP